MPAPRAGVSGIAIALIGTGALLLWSAIHDVPVLDALRSLARGQAPTVPDRSTQALDPDAAAIQQHWSQAPPGVSGAPGLPGGLRDYPDTYGKPKLKSI